MEIRPWGNYIVLYDGQDCKVKRITVNPGHRLSYQYHNYRSEHWTVVQGSGIITFDDVQIPIEANDNVFIPAKSKHRIMNNTAVDLVFIEVQTGSYFGEDDIIRLEDDYKRI